MLTTIHSFWIDVPTCNLVVIYQCADGTRPLIPKDEGMGIMLSSFTSREFGYGFVLTFVSELEYGSNKEGYWTYDNMVLQLEDCIDCIKCLYPDYDFMFLE
mmetsp:Transcript_4361/g.5020  ORF Transcript_4361/g.5020 Transcript_4361/m.5020 type:complete len:101 (+) Transcript_4361:1324-1626(+)